MGKYCERCEISLVTSSIAGMPVTLSYHKFKNGKKYCRDCAQVIRSITIKNNWRNR